MCYWAMAKNKIGNQCFKFDEIVRDWLQFSDIHIIREIV